MNTIKEKTKKYLKPYMGLPREVYVIFFSRIINAIGVFVFPLLTLILTEKIGLSIGEAGFWISTTGFLFIPASLIGGKLADSIGRKKMIVIFDTLAALTYVVIAFIEPSMSMIYLIMLASVFFGMADPAHGALIADVTTPENRDGAYSLSYLGFNIGFAIGPIIGGFLFENHLQIIFLGDAITALIATSLVLIFVGETIEKTKEDLGEDRNLEKREEGSIFSVLLKRPILIYFALIAFGYNFVYSQWSFMIPLHAEQNFIDEGAKLFGFLGGFNGFIVIVFTPILTSLFMKRKNIRKIVYGGILYIIGFGMLGFISTKLAFFISVSIFTLGEILIVISFMPFIANHTPASHRGRMNSILPMIMGLGFTLGPLIMGNAIEYITIESGWKIIGLIMIISTSLMFVLEKVDNKNKAPVNKPTSKEEMAISN